MAYRSIVEQSFRNLSEKIINNKFKTLFLCLFVFSIFLYFVPHITIDTTTEGMLHAEDPSVIDYNNFRDQFGRDEFIVVALETETGDVFTQDFLKQLKSLHEDIESTVPYLDDVTSLINARNTRGEGDQLIVEDLMETWPETDADMAAIKQRVVDNPLFRNTLISDDGKLTTIIITTQAHVASEAPVSALDGFDDQETINPASFSSQQEYITNDQNSEVVVAVREAIKRHQSSDYKIYLAGSPVITHRLLETLLPDANKFLNLALLLIIVFLFILFRRLSGVFLPLVVVISTLLSTLGLMAMCGVAIKLTTQILPSFLIAVCVGDAVHILSVFYKQYDEEGNKEKAIIYAMGHSGLAVALTSLTTAAGLASFLTADIAPIADLGIFASIGVIFGLFYSVVLLPVLLALLPVKPKKIKAETKDGAMDKLLCWIADFSTTYPKSIVAATIIIIGLSGFMALKVDFSHLILKWLPENDPVRVATEKLDHDLKGSFALNIVIDTGRENGLYDPDLLNRFEQAATHLESMKYEEVFVGKAWSLSTVLKEINQALNENRKAFYSVPQDKNLIAQELLLFEMSGSDDLEDFVDSQFSKAHFVAKVPFVDAIKYTIFLKDVRAYFKKTFPDADVTITGLIALMLQTVTSAINSMIESYIIAMSVITVLMILLIGGVRIGLLSMIPNLFPILLGLGMMSVLRIPMDMFSLLFASIVIGIAVDDTIHFMHNFRRYYEQTGDPKQAVHETLQTAGRAMLTTTIVLSASFLIYTQSTMQNLFNFGVLTAFALAMALVADFFIAPALMMLANPKKNFQKTPD